ncbi:hypothetical protein [Pseudoxanthomonas wuyuanensis]|uniref:Transmembrane protein n=1 Tax=Pseudoxanthomonas wuyuanensis TaxID=1073196 RepID=A0A286DBP7_9GAMM|nr:hypothetical protein [Pseudoxanthomonas wuyuanensis]KAF1721703.1 hypothetical protein CSC75_05675 [Pseudoxanthomonas wuyuanensis]SOD56076.1 hypothetical protein SAMN06296416_108163 [Pseudoxanthomonas wuyuanensis]
MNAHAYPLPLAPWRLLLVLVLVAAPALASPPSVPAHDSPFAQIANEIERETPAGSIPPQLLLQDREDHAAYLRWQREFSRQSWEWHLRSTKLLMYVVLVIVFFGLFITYLQFTHDRRMTKRLRKAVGGAGAELDELPADNDPPDKAADSSTLKLGPAGLEITSQVIGLLVLGFSLAFFYFYVKDVYPMQELELKQQAKTVPAPSADTSEYR